MLSQKLQCSLEREIVGQERAVETVLRAVTIAMGGLGEDDAPLGIYLFVGPVGTGKAHLARSLARLLHGDLERLAVVDCNRIGSHDEWASVIPQLAPLFPSPAAAQDSPWVAPQPLSILLIDHLEAARPEFAQTLVATLRSGSLPLPEGRHGSLHGCLVLLASKICAREVYEAGPKEIGFSSATDVDRSEKARIYQLCCSAVEKRWGEDFLAELDDLIVFHRLREMHLPALLHRQLAELNAQLARCRVLCVLEPPAADFVLTRSADFLHHGAPALLRNFRRFVRFPLADMIHGGGVPPDTTVVVQRDEDGRLRFSVTGKARPATLQREGPVGVPVVWED